MGVSYGHCQNCTPSEVFRLRDQLGTEETAAGRRYDEIHTAEREIYVKLATAATRIKYDNAYKKGRDAQ